MNRERKAKSRRRGPLAVAVTGGIGAGKSTFCRLMAALGEVVHLDADQVVHELLATDPAVREAVRERFGDAAFRSGGEIDREGLAARVFADPGERKALEAILHPAARRELRHRREALRQRGDVAIVLIEIPLLVETDAAEGYDLVVTVEAPRKARVARLAQKGFSETEIRRRMASQTSSAARRRAADLVVWNRGGRDALERRVRALWGAWRRWGSE